MEKRTTENTENRATENIETVVMENRENRITDNLGNQTMASMDNQKTGKMEIRIAENMHEPAELEKMFRQEPGSFKRSFQAVFALNPDSHILRVWNERLKFEPDVLDEVPDRSKRGEIVLVFILALVAGVIAKLVFELDKDRQINVANYAFAVFPAMAFYFIYKERPQRNLLAAIALLFAISVVYLNLLPLDKPGQGLRDSVFLAGIHLPIFLWALTGMAFCGSGYRNSARRMEYLKFTGEALIYMALLYICAMILAAITMGLFQAIQVQIDQFYVEVIGVFGIAAIPVVATYLATMRSGVSQTIAPYLAKIFSPLALLTLAAYLATMLVVQRNPYNDRDFLLIFNLMLIGVLALVIFSLSEREEKAGKLFGDYVLFLLVVIAVIIDVIALSAIVLRLSTYGPTPNRAAIFGLNVVIFGNLLLIAYNYWRFFRGKVNASTVQLAVTGYLPAYAGWAALVTFAFPFIFWFA